jgi:hypothetical protein
MDAEGGGWFLGGSLSYVHRGSTLIGSLGVERRHMEMAPTGDPGLREVDYRATGVGVRFMIAWTPSGRFMQYYTPSDIRHRRSGPTPALLPQLLRRRRPLRPASAESVRE